MIRAFQWDLARLVNAATRAGIKVVSIVNLLGQTQYLIKVPGLRDLNELRAPGWPKLDWSRNRAVCEPQFSRSTQ